MQVSWGAKYKLNRMTATLNKFHAQSNHQALSDINVKVCFNLICVASCRNEQGRFA